MTDKTRNYALKPWENESTVGLLRDTRTIWDSEAAGRAHGAWQALRVAASRTPASRQPTAAVISAEVPGSRRWKTNRA